MRPEDRSARHQIEYVSAVMMGVAGVTGGGGRLEE